MTTSHTYLAGFPIPRILAKQFLYLQDRIPGYYLVMCRGYNEDDANFTELVWDDDKDLDYSDRQSYPEFRIWIRRFRMGDRNGKILRVHI